MEVLVKAYSIVGFLLLTTCTSAVLSASLKGSFEQLDISFAPGTKGSSSTTKTPGLNTIMARNPVRDAALSISVSCSTPTTMVNLQPTTSTVYAAFTSTKFRVVKRAVVSTETVFESTVMVTATPTSKALQSTAVASPSVQFAPLSSVLVLDEYNEVNSTTLLEAANEVHKTMTGRLTNIVRRVVSMTMGVLLTPFAIVAQHLNQN